MDKIFCILLFYVISSVFQVNALSPPMINNGVVKFSNGFILKYSDTKVVLFSSPELALAKKSPVSFTEKPILINEWGRIFLIRKNYYYEGNNTEISVYNFDGLLLSPTLKFVGDIRFLKNKGKILLVQKSSHRIVKRSFILDVDGKLISTIEHGEIFDYGVSKDEELIWFYVRIAKDMKAMTEIIIMDFLGNMVGNEKVSGARVLQFKYKGNIYKIEVQLPELPG